MSDHFVLSLLNELKVPDNLIEEFQSKFQYLLNYLISFEQNTYVSFVLIVSCRIVVFIKIKRNCILTGTTYLYLY